jgi:hypothetical protein
MTTDAKEPEGINEPHVITALHLLRDHGFTALYDAEERPAADIAEILDAWATLTRERDEARRDAARLDWLEKYGVRTDWCDPENPDSVWIIFSDNRKDWDAAGGSANSDTLRAAIDAARTADAGAR